MRSKIGKILVVDDEPLMRDTLELGLRGDFDVWKVASGGEALAATKENEFPVVILDLRMDGMSGIETLRELRKSDPDQKVIILTAHQSMQTAIEAVNLGAFNYLTKPCDLIDLRRLVRSGFRLYNEERIRKEEIREHLMAAHDEVFSALCHEFNTPLNGIIGFAGLLADESESAEHREMAQHIEVSGKRLHEVFVEIMEYVNSSRPSAVDKKEEFSIRSLQEWLASMEFPCDAHLIFSGAEEEASSRYSGPFKSLKTIFSKIAQAGKGEDRKIAVVAWLRQTESTCQMHFQLQGVGLLELLKFAGSPEALFSPYATASLSLIGANNGLGLHLATCRNIADSAGIALKCDQSSQGNVRIGLEMPVVPLGGESRD